LIKAKLKPHHEVININTGIPPGTLRDMLKSVNLKVKKPFVVVTERTDCSEEGDKNQVKQSKNTTRTEST
jgi:hypothetical protein